MSGSAQLHERAHSNALRPTPRWVALHSAATARTLAALASKATLGLRLDQKHSTGVDDCSRRRLIEHFRVAYVGRDPAN